MPKYLLGALGLTALASVSLIDRPSNADTPAPIPAGANPLAMTASNQCDGVRDLVIDTLVHNLVVGYGYTPYPYGYNYRGGMDRAAVASKAAEPAPAPPAASKAAPPRPEPAPQPS